jgi:hypothetical protein
MGRPWSAVSGLALAVGPLCRALGPAKENTYGAGVPRWVYSVGLLKAKTEIPD